MVGKTLLLDGSYTNATLTTPVDFTAATAASVVVPFDLNNLELRSGSENVFVISKAGSGWFNGVDFAQITADQIAAKVLSNLKTDLSLASE
jgi:hypothetical protein